MNILGIGIPELIVIFIIMLVVAGPKRMIEWSYHIGRYASKLRAMYQETMDAFQKELNASGLDGVTKDLASLRTSSFDIVNEASKIINTEVSSATSEAEAAASAASSLVTPSTPSITPASSTSSGNSTSSEPVPPPSSDSKSDGEQPRYDSWLPN